MSVTSLPDLTTELMDHQARAVDKLQRVKVGALYMDMVLARPGRPWSLLSGGCRREKGGLRPVAMSGVREEDY